MASNHQYRLSFHYFYLLILYSILINENYSKIFYFKNYLLTYLLFYPYLFLLYHLFYFSSSDPISQSNYLTIKSFLVCMESCWDLIWGIQSLLNFRESLYFFLFDDFQTYMICCTKILFCFYFFLFVCELLSLGLE